MRARLMVATTMMCLLLTFFHWRLLHVTRQVPSHLLQQGSGHVPPKRILMWTSMFKRNKPSLWSTVFVRQLSGQCPVSNCELLYDNKLLHQADAVLMFPLDLQELPPRRPHPRQLWVFYSHEAPPILSDKNVSIKRLGGVFNWTMTYRRDSDVVVPYGRVWPIVNNNSGALHGPISAPRRPPSLPASPASLLKDYWATKSIIKFASWMVSNCKTDSKREEYVQHLRQNGVSVDIYGKCGDKKCAGRLTLLTARNKAYGNCNEKIQEYMFYLAFENAICEDYVTEKLYLALTLDVVPVVLGGAQYRDFAPPNSYIDALQFASPKQLADHLRTVAASPALYNKYFEWKQHFTVELGHPFSPMICDLCARLHDPASFTAPAVSRSDEKGGPASTWGRDANGSYPDIYRWFVEASKCREWSG